MTFDDTPSDDNNAARWTPNYNGGIRARFEKRFLGGEYLHTMTPRLGLEINGKGNGDSELPDFDFEDDRDTLEEDNHYARFDFNTELSKFGQSFGLELLSRWALRSKERTYTDDNGNTQTSSSSLVDVRGKLNGKPVSYFDINSNFRYDGLRGNVTDFDLSATLRINKNVSLRNTTTWLTDDDNWNYETGITASGNRYRLDLDVTNNPGGLAIDRYKVRLSRRAVDGEFGLEYTTAWDENRNRTEESITLTFVWNESGFF